MNKHLNFDDIISLLAIKSGKERCLCELFLQELIHAVNKQLLVGETVEIEGLGCFQLNKKEIVETETQSKEYRKLIFFPNQKLIETVNKPFSVFEVTELNDSITFEGLDLVEEDSIEQKHESSQWIEFKTISLTPVSIIKKVSIKQSEGLIEPEEKKQVKTQTNKLEFILAGLVLTLFVALSFFIWIIYRNSSYQFQTDSETVTDGTPQQSNTENIDNHTLLLDTALIETIPEVNEEKLKRQRDSVQTVDSLVKIRTKKIDYANKYIATEVIKKGSRLTLLALKYYGHKIFWVYIYEANKEHIDNPNNIDIGTEIKIPQPEAFEIDAKSKKSRLEATKKQQELLENK
jgi:nucleoid DNA-binding protein